MPSFDTTRLSAQAQIDLITAIPPGKDIYGVLTADLTLLSQITVQKLFNFGANSGGVLALPTGIYEFDALSLIDTMSATSGNGVFDLLGAGTATLANICQQAVGVDATTQATQAAAGAAVTTTKTIDMAVAAIGAALGTKLSGTFSLSVAGTIIPSVLLTTAAAAVHKAGSFMRIRRLGEYGTNYNGAWY